MVDGDRNPILSEPGRVVSVLKNAANVTPIPVYLRKGFLASSTITLLDNRLNSDQVLKNSNVPSCIA